MACKQIKEALFPRHQGAKPAHDELPSLIPLSSGLLAGAGRAWGDGRTAAHRNTRPSGACSPNHQAHVELSAASGENLVEATLYALGFPCDEVFLHGDDLETLEI